MTAQYKHAILLLLDGARPDVLQDEMQKGHLPNLQKLTQNGTNQAMLTCFPSTTGPAYLPYVTGCFPGTCNVPGIRWFDKGRYSKKGWGWGSFRSYCGLEAAFFDKDMHQHIPTAWEVFENPKSINNGVTKGINKKNNLTTTSRFLEFYYAHLTDRWDFIDRATTRRALSVIDKKDFDFLFMVFSSVDELSHRSSPFHKNVREAYHRTDEKVGQLIEHLKKAGIYDDTLFLLFSDHGLSETHNHFDVGPWMEEEKNLKTFYYTNILKFKFDAVSMISGNGMAHLYFEGQKGWGERLSFEELSHKFLLLDELRFTPEVDLVVTQGADSSIHFQTDLGHSQYRVRGDKVFYQFNNQDPLQIFKAGDPRLDQGLTFDEMMAESFDSHYPDVFMQMHQLFKSPRTGDVVLSAKTGNDLREKFEHPLHKASHGAICPEHMKIPLVSNHKFNQKYVRSVDIYPTVLKLMGKDVPEGLDGKSLV